VPSPSDLHAEPPLGPLLLLDLAAAVAANALRAHHVSIEGGARSSMLAAAASAGDLCSTLARRRSVDAEAGNPRPTARRRR
jgi:hypothetical protein